MIPAAILIILVGAGLIGSLLHLQVSNRLLKKRLRALENRVQLLDETVSDHIIRLP